VRENSGWRIAGVDVSQEDRVGDDTPQCAWELNPVAYESTVYEHGSWELVVEFNDAPQDSDAQFRIENLREDDGSLARAQEDGGIIEAGKARLTLDSDWTGYHLSQPGFEPGVHWVVATVDGIEVSVGQLTVGRHLCAAGQEPASTPALLSLRPAGQFFAGPRVGQGAGRPTGWRGRS
jgi:hypothetical protein